MDRKELEQILKSQKNTFVPNINNRIQEIKNMGIKRVPVSDKQNKHTAWNYKTAIAAACSLVIILGALALFLLLPQQSPSAQHFLYLETNPSIKLCINDKGKVTDVTMLNEDATNTFDEGQIKGKKYNKAFDAIIGSLYDAHYFDNEDYEVILSMEEGEDSLLITKYNNYIIEKISSYNITVNVIKNALSKQDITEIEQDNRLTPGKLKYIKEIAQISEEIDTDELKDMGLDKLRKIKYILQEDTEASFEELKDLEDNELNDKYIQTKDDVGKPDSPDKGEDDDDDDVTIIKPPDDNDNDDDDATIIQPPDDNDNDGGSTGRPSEGNDDADLGPSRK